MPGDHVDGSTVKGDSMASSQKNTSYKKMSLKKMVSVVILCMDGCCEAYHSKKCYWGNVKSVLSSLGGMNENDIQSQKCLR